MKRIVNALDKLKLTYAVFVLLATTSIALPAQTFTTLLSLDGADGDEPLAGLVQATNGDLYGTTEFAGAYNAGTVFQIAPSGALTTLYSFCSQSGCTDGRGPLGGLVQDINGDFYGTTVGGGANGDYGTVFKITPSGTLTTLYSFCSQSGCTDGANPEAGLVQATNGDLYGTTYDGGAQGDGTVFRTTPSGKLTTLYSFCAQTNCADGVNPVAGLVQTAKGDFYGTTKFGGAYNAGTVFQIAPSGTLTTLYSFCAQENCPDGQSPASGLLQASNGNFYGTTTRGGAHHNGGTAFQITPSGKLTTLYSFCAQTGCTDGEIPYAGLVQATNGDFYGTTAGGGANCTGIGGCGTVFRITPSGTLTTLYSFCAQSGCTDGRGPLGGLVQDTNGAFYGTTNEGGATGDGVVFALSVGLGPFVETQMTSGPVGAGVKILGSDLTGATSVSFNGTAAAFTVVSRYFIVTTVPTGATTGRVEVVTPSHTLSSNVPFRVP